VKTEDTKTISETIAVARYLIAISRITKRTMIAIRLVMTAIVAETKTVVKTAGGVAADAAVKDMAVKDIVAVKGMAVKGMAVAVKVGMVTVSESAVFTVRNLIDRLEG
jgi:hypothetical protein